MSLVDDLVKDLLGGLTKHVKFGQWDGSFDGHPHSVTVDNSTTSVKFDGATFVPEFPFSVASAFPTAGNHVLKGKLALPNTTQSIDMDGTAKTGHIIITGHVKGGKPRIEVMFKYPEPGDPNNHYRFDADISVT